MTFNAGAFAGALGQSALSTYERLGEAGFRNLQRQQMAQEMQEKADLDQAWRESQARVGQQDEFSQAIKTEGFASGQQAKMLSDQGALRGNTAEDQAFERASAEAAAGALRENAVRQGAIPESKAALPELKPTEYTAKQGMQAFLDASKGISRKATLEALQLKNVMREADIQDKFDLEQEKLNDTLARIHGTAESGGLKGLAEAAKKEGLKVEFVEGKNGVGSRIQVLGPKGDVLENISDIGTATKKLSQAAMQQFYDKGVALLGSPDKVLSFMQGEKKLAIAEREAATKEKVGTAQANYYGAAAANLGAKANSFVDKLPEKEKIKLKAYDSSVASAEKLYAADPTNPANQLNLGKALVNRNKAWKQHGMVDDIYEGTGIPSPQEAAAQIIGAKITNKADIDKRIAVAKQQFGRDYADEVRIALTENNPAAPGNSKSALPVGSNVLRDTVYPGSARTHDGLPARQNPDGSRSTEVSITVTDPRLNGGKPTNIPSLWGGKEVDQNTAIKNAINSGNKYQSFSTIDEAVSAAKARSNAGGAGAR